MKEQKKKEIAINVSSGAEKVEAVEKERKASQSGKTVSKTTVKKTETKPTTDKIDVKKMNAASTNGKAEKESEAAKARVAAALKKKEEKEKRKAERKAQAEKRAAERKAKAEKRAAERKAKAEKLAAARKEKAEKREAEREAKIRERAHAKANRSQAKSRKKQQKKQNGDERKSQRKSYGGWLAAVISLGVITLALSAIVTVGAMDMKRTKDGTISGYRATTYELIGVMENVDNDLDRVRVSASPAQQSRILTDLLVQARVAEIDLEKLPIDGQADKNLTAFINRVAAESQRMLAKLRNGESLSEKDAAVLQNLYEINHSVRRELDEYAANMTNQDLMSFMKNGEGALGEVLERVENATLQENRPDMAEERRAVAPPMGEEGSAKIEASKAEDLCATYFSDYNINEFQCIGETVGRGYTAYNVQGYDNEGTLLFAEIDCRTGALLRFDYYKECNENTFDMDNSKRIAEAFLEKLGYEDMTAVRVRENGTDADFTFVYETDGVVFYPDAVRVKICRSRGVVTGFDAGSFLMHHTDREAPEATLTLADARGRLHEGLEVEAARLAVVATPKGERAAYEFLCSYGEEEYVIYLNASSGEEIAIVNLKNLR